MIRHPLSIATTVILLVLALLCLALSARNAAAANPVSPSGKEPISLLTGMDFIRDPSGKMTIDDVARLAATTGDSAFQPASGKFSQGYTRDVFWLRIILSCGQCVSNRWLLVAGPPFIDDIRLYVPGAGHSYTEHRAGDHVPVKQRPLAAPEMAFPLELGEMPRTYYLRVQSTSTVSLFLALYAPEIYAEERLRKDMLNGLFLGLLLSSALISLFGAIWLRQAFYAASTLYLLCYGVQQFAFNGYDQLLVFPDTPALADITVGAASTLLPGLFLFFLLSYIEPQRHYPRLSATLIWLARLNVGAACLTLFGYYPWIAPYLPAYVLLIALPAFALLFMMLRHEQQRARLMLWMFLPSVVVIIPQLLRNLGYLPANFWTTYLWQLSGFLQMPFTAIVILLRVRDEERTRNLAQERERAQRDFLNMVAHELRNPLAVICASLANIEARTEASHPELESRYRRIDTALAKLNGLVANALTEERLNTGKVEIHPQPLAPSEFARQAQALFSPGESHPLQVRLPKDDTPVPIDAHWLVIAALNLLDNAVKYSPQGGTVMLEIQRGDGSLAIQVSDHGIGIPAHAQASIGQRFFRAENALALPGVHGLGLGLYFVCQIAELHGGKLQVHSKPGHGSTFSIEIPAPKVS